MHLIIDSLKHPFACTFKEPIKLPTTETRVIINTLLVTARAHLILSALPQFQEIVIHSDLVLDENWINVLKENASKVTNTRPKEKEYVKDKAVLKQVESTFSLLPSNKHEQEAKSRMEFPILEEEMGVNRRKN